MGCIRGKATCVFARLNVQEVEVGNNVKKVFEIPQADTCIFGKGDQYGIEVHSSVGIDGLNRWHEVQPSDQDPFVITAGDKFLWESLSSHNTTGDAYHVNRHDHIPALYHEKDWIEPTAKGINVTDTCDLVGHDNFVLELQRWHEDGYGQPIKILGIPRVEVCRGFYGIPDLETGVSVHKSMRSWWNQVPTWANFTTNMMYGDKCKLNIHTSPWEKIEKWVCENIHEEQVQARLLEGYLLLKSNKYIPIRHLLRGNGVEDEHIHYIMTTIGTKNLRSIYTTGAGTKYNVDQVRRLYFALKRGKYNIDHEVANTYMCNIINYILNDNNGLGRVTPINLRMAPSDRYWHAIDIVSSALYEDGIIASVDKLPKWFKSLVQQHVALKKDIQYTDEYDINPPVWIVRDLLDIQELDEKPYAEFAKVQRVIRRISPQELQSVWFHWKNAWHKEKPEMFWDYIKSIIKGHDFEGTCTLTTLEQPFNWATNILEACLDDQTFDVDKNDNAISPYWQVDEWKPEPTYEHEVEAL